MKISTLALVGNECDIIELFIRINSRYIDHFFIADLGSSDATPLILRKLKEEGYPITYWLHPVNFPAGGIQSEHLRRIADEDLYDWIFLLDADEFLTGTRTELENQLASVPPACCASLKWKTYVPESDNYFEIDNPLHALFAPRDIEYLEFIKIALPKSKAGSITIAPGNHDCLDNGQPAQKTPIETVLAHCPVRSIPQIILKALLGSHQVSVAKGRNPNEYYHWDLMAQFIRDNNYHLSVEQLRNIAFSYALRPDDPVSYRLSNGPKIGFDSDRIVYRELSKINPASRADAFIKVLCGRLIECMNEETAAMTTLQSSRAGIGHLEARLRSIQAECEILRLQNQQLTQAVESAKNWQRSWFRRIFHRWRPPDAQHGGPGFLRRLERSIRKRLFPS